MNRPYTLGSVSLFLGDMMIFLLFAFLGRIEHEMEIALGSILFTALPFMIAWCVVGSFTGIFRPESVKNIKAVFVSTTTTWFIAGSLGLLLRGLFLQAAPSVVFALVTIGLMLILFLIWRITFMFGFRRAE